MARGPARYAEPLIHKHQPACKPGSVGHRLLAQAVRDGHSSGTIFAHGLEQPTRTASLTSPCGVIARRRTFRVAIPIRFCSRCGLPCRFRRRIRGALLPHLFTLTAPTPEGEGGRFVLCGTFPGVAPAGRYPAPYVDGARTFLPRSLSTIAGAAVRPTDDLVMGARGGGVKGSRWLIGVRPARVRAGVYCAWGCFRYFAFGHPVAWKQPCVVSGHGMVPSPGASARRRPRRCLPPARCAGGPGSRSPR
jgi:hypothetical protein